MPESPTAVITPYLCVHDGVAALAFYKAAFDAVETVRYTGADGQIGHAEVEILGARVMLSDEWAAGQVLGKSIVRSTTVAARPPCISMCPASTRSWRGQPPPARR